MVDVTQTLVGYVRVNLGGCNVTVAQEFLDAPQINALVEQIGGVAVAQRVRSGEDGDARKHGIFFDHAFNGSGC